MKLCGVCKSQIIKDYWWVSNTGIFFCSGICRNSYDSEQEHLRLKKETENHKYLLSSIMEAYIYG
jgi:hypothetical protein